MFKKSTFCLNNISGAYIFVISALTELPSAPENLKVSDVQVTTAVLQWQPPRDDGGSEILHYIIEDSVNRQDFVRIAKVEGFSTKLKAKDLEEGKEHVFRVSAVNEIGASEPIIAEPVTPMKPLGKGLYNSVK